MGVLSKMDEFSEKFQRGGGGGGEIQSAFFKECSQYNFDKKKHTVNPEITLLYQFHAQKALLEVPKICNINFWIENDPPPPPP